MTKEIPTEQLLKDYSKLGDNSFWHYYIDELQRRYVLTCQTMGNADNETNNKLRILQGKSQGYKESYVLPRLMVDELEKKRKKRGNR